MSDPTTAGDILPSDRPFFDFAQAAQDMLLRQLQGLREHDPATHAALTRSPAVWRITCVIMLPEGRSLVESTASLPSGEVIGLEAVEFQRRVPS